MTRVIVLTGGIPVDVRELALGPLNKNVHSDEKFGQIAEQLAQLKQEFTSR